MSYDIDHNGTYEFTRVIDRSRDALLRDSGFQLKDGTTIENQATYGYSPADGRLATISGGGLQPPNQFSYSYLASSNLIESVTKSAPVGSPVIQKLNSYESNRDVLATISNNVITANGGGFDTVTRSVYDYTTVNGGVNSLGQRGGVRSTFNLGTLTANPGDTSWGYDNLGQLQSADPPGTDADRYYQFDTIGNRLLSRTGTATNTGGTLTEYFGTVANSTPSGPGANALNQYAAIKTAPTIVQPYHDDDGNATAYPLPVSPTTNSTLVWDAENRQISATVNGVTTTYLYDALSRRIAKIPATGAATLYIYDGFNCIAEYTGTTLTKARTWGIDLSGTLQGAGGVGGLLMEKQGANSFYPTYDGNGNVSEYLTSTGAVAAHFEYDPFGNTTVNTDSNNLFVYRFSTKPLDFETGLYYYGYRYYDPLTGRWPSRDPIGEKGGVNLYGYVFNAPNGWYDFLGRDPQSAIILLIVADTSANQPQAFKKIERDVISLNETLARCCKELNIGCNVSILPMSPYNPKNGGPPAPKVPPIGGYPRNANYKQIAGAIGPDGAIPVTYTNSDHGGGFSGGQGGLGMPGAGVILDMGDGFTTNGLSHELGHVGGYDGGTEDNKAHHPDPPGGAFPDDKTPVMARGGGWKVNECYCKKLIGLARVIN